jgi:hypothetical protein
MDDNILPLQFLGICALDSQRSKDGSARNQVMMTNVVTVIFPSQVIAKPWRDDKECVAHGILNGNLKRSASGRISLLIFSAGLGDSDGDRTITFRAAQLQIRRVSRRFATAGFF